jgi:GNAT superfamily N-acetyltransferase
MHHRVESEIGHRAADGREDDALAAVMFDSIHHGRSLYTPDQRHAWLPAPYGGAPWSARLSGQAVFVAREKGRITGFMTLDGGYIDLAFIAADRQGRGLFRALYREVELLARDTGVERLTTHASLMAQPAFVAVGFRAIRHENVARGGQTLSRAEMEKRLR